MTTLDPARKPRAGTPALLLVAPLFLLPSCGGGDPTGPQNSGSGVGARVEWWDAAETLKRAESQTLWGKLHGTHSEWSAEGINLVSGQYEDGRKVGDWEEFANDGRRIALTPFVDGKEHGVAQAWHPDGERRSEGEYARGIQIGTWKNYSPDGETESATFENGVIQSIDVWYSTGEKRSELRNDWIKGTGTLVEWWASGAKRREAELKDGNLHGIDTRYHEIGEKMAEENWEEGNKHGVSRTWHPTGELRSEGEMKQGVGVGVWHEWHLNGQLQKEGLYVDGGMTGEWRQWYDSGTLKSIVFFSANIPENLLQEWHPGGKRSSFGNLVRGHRRGPWFYWTEDGELDLDASGQYFAKQRTGDLTDEERDGAGSLAADPSPILPPAKPPPDQEPEPKDG